MLEKYSIKSEKQQNDSWTKDISHEVVKNEKHIKAIISEGESRDRFDAFFARFKTLLNPNVNEEMVIEMLAQHIIVRPVFDVLFDGYSFAKSNNISKEMQGIIDFLTFQGLEIKNERIEAYALTVKRDIIDATPDEREELIKSIYNNFFLAVFPATAKQLGIVYTPYEVVDFINLSVSQILEKELGVSLGHSRVEITDPFTGTGTFITRMIKSGLLPKEALKRKFSGESGCVRAQELVLLAYYVASLNINEALLNTLGDEFTPWDGVVLCDTFSCKGQEPKEPKDDKIHVIIGNPPYFRGQKLDYPKLYERVKETFAYFDMSGGKSSMYDSCNLALRYASDKMGDEGIVGFVTNGSFINGTSTGMRHCLMQEFSHIYCFNLRGNTRMRGELVNMEGGKIFGSGSRVAVVVLILVKKKGFKAPGTLHYYDIGDYLNREEKLNIISKFGSTENIPWEEITPNKHHDWINRRSETLNKFIPLGSKETKGDADSNSIFINYASGVLSSRDAWVYNFSRKEVVRNMDAMITEYNRHVDEYPKHIDAMRANPKNWDFWVNNNPTEINWTVKLRSRLYGKKRLIPMNENRMIPSQYRPFAKRQLYYDRDCLGAVCQKDNFFPSVGADNKMICVSGAGAEQSFSALVVGVLPEYAVVQRGPCFPLYTWEQVRTQGMTPAQLKATRRDNITDYALNLFIDAYPNTDITKEDIFHYIYGILHSPEYNERFGGDLKRIFVHMPLAKNFACFRDAGRMLCELHLNYESVEPFKLNLSLNADYTNEPTESNFDYYQVDKMRFGTGKDKSIIQYNPRVSLSGIPLSAYDYHITDRSAIEWVINQYRIQKDTNPRSGSGIVNDPNALAREENNPRYVLDLLLSVITVSVETMKIISSLPKEDSFREDDATLDFIKNSKAQSLSFI